ncbi:unnamed protein product [Moneuplotes crassus]|uniref:Uncharacterized protein n=1 Tax=Euplotes crassus TaxID=5936 RepID=A0AAD1UMJ3_EUPCR|nr:unnamed protein product [Moneuplotes crassus]
MLNTLDPSGFKEAKSSTKNIFFRKRQSQDYKCGRSIISIHNEGDQCQVMDADSDSESKLPKKVQFRKNQTSRGTRSVKRPIRSKEEWMLYIEGKKRINDDLRQTNNEQASLSSTLFYKAATGPIKANVVRNRKPRGVSQSSSLSFKPFTPQLGKIGRIVSNAKSKSPFYQLPTQNEINKMLASIGDKTQRIKTTNNKNARSRLFDFERKIKSNILSKKMVPTELKKLIMEDD